jgi:hypothetical protein
VLNKKGSELIAKNTVEAILFLLVFVVAILIVRNWWLLYQSKGMAPALKSLDALQKSINQLDPEYSGVARVVPIQTNNFIIKGYSNPDICALIKDNAEYCICTCKSNACDEAFQDPGKYCRYVMYDSNSITLGGIDQVKNFVVRLKNDAVQISVQG